LPLTSLLISVTEPTVNPQTEEVTYKLSLMDPERPTVSLHRVFRPWKACKTVIKKIQTMSPDPPLPTMPKTKVFGATEKAYLEERCEALEAVLNAICANRFLVKDTDFLELVGYKEYTSLRTSLGPGAFLTDIVQVSTVGQFLTFPKLTEREGDITAARCWLRSTPYTFVSVLPDLCHPSLPSRKTHLLITDAAGVPYLLSVIPVDPRTSPNEIRGEKLKSLQRLLTTLDREYFAPAVHIDVVEDIAYCIRQIAKEGSVLDAISVEPLESRNPLESGIKKYKGGFVPTPIRHLRAWGRKILQIMSICASYNIPLPHLSLGNLLVSERSGIVLSDLESVLLGSSRFPASVTPLDSLQAAEGEGGEGNVDNGSAMAQHSAVNPATGLPRTNFDVLLFGVLLYQLAIGQVLSPTQITALLTTQGDPFSLPVEDAPAEDGDDAPVLSTSSSAFSATSATFAAAPKFTFSDCPEPVRNLLLFIFNPVCPADLRVLLHHQFFAVGEEPGASNEGITPGPVKFKKKDLALFGEAVEKWRFELEDRAAVRRRRVEERERIRELKRRGRTPSPGPQSPTSTGSSPATPSLAPMGAPPLPPTSLLTSQPSNSAPAPPPLLPPPVTVTVAPPSPPPPVQPTASAATNLPPPAPPAGLPPPPPPPPKGLPPPAPPKGLPPPPPPPKFAPAAKP
jgi:hypothetical protein